MKYPGHGIGHPSDQTGPTAAPQILQQIISRSELSLTRRESARLSMRMCWPSVPECTWPGAQVHGASELCSVPCTCNHGQMVARGQREHQAFADLYDFKTFEPPCV